MLDRQKRLIEVYEYARKHLAIHTQIDFAKAIGFSRAVISSALNGNDQYLTDSLFNRISDKYPGVFNLDYLLTGKGDLLLTDAKVPDTQQKAVNNLPDSRNESNSNLVNALLAAKDETIASLRQQIEEQKEMIAFLKQRVSDLSAASYPLPDHKESHISIPKP